MPTIERCRWRYLRSPTARFQCPTLFRSHPSLLEPDRWATADARRRTRWEWDPKVLPLGKRWLALPTAAQALIVCVPMIGPAVYNPIMLIVPAAVLPPGTPSTDQETVWFTAPDTEAVNCWFALRATETLVGVTAMVAGVTVSKAVPTMPAEVACTVLDPG